MHTIHVIDEMMGTGKTTGMFKRMLANAEDKYLYITPLLSELQKRIPKEIPELNFVEPNTTHHASKTKHFKELLKQGRNICSTHALYQGIDNECIELIKAQGYHCVIDEEVCMISEVQGYSKGDISSLYKKELIAINQSDFGKVDFLWDIPEDHKYDRLRKMCDVGCVYATSGNAAFVTQLPIALLTAANKTTLLTYGFFGSMLHAFLECRGFSFERDTVELRKTSEQAKKSARNLIEIVDHIGIRKVEKYPKTVTWWSEDSTISQQQEIMNAIGGLLRKHKVKPNDLLITFMKDIYEKGNVFIPRYKLDKSFLYTGARATNDYAHKTFLVHAYNRFPNVTVYNYLQQYGGNPNRDKIALYEMLQWIWRSAIRNDQPIKICIANKRMRKLFEAWLDT